MQILECVPNLSLAAAPEKLRAVMNAVESVPGVRLLHADENPAANRTVLTFAGEARAVVQAAKNCIQKTLEAVDMRRHKGAHPRLGALDVCPLVPIEGLTLQDAARLARELGEYAAARFRLPVYLYEAAAADPLHKNLADVRRGEYESLPQKLLTFPPDFGPRQWDERVQKSGACIIGARKPLIAFNVNLNTADPAPAKQIAAVLREKNGGLKNVKAIGWYMENFGRAQVSFNLTDYEITGPAQAFEAVRREAAKRGLTATGCELVGLIPLRALLAAARYYAPRARFTQEEAVRLAAQKLNLSDVKPFDANRQILEYRLRELTARPTPGPAQ